MTTTDPNTVGAAPWYDSPVQISQIVACISGVFTVFPQLPALLGMTDTAKITATVSVTAAIAGLIFRARSKIQPLTLTQARADNHPATTVADSNKLASYSAGTYSTEQKK